MEIRSFLPPACLDNAVSHKSPQATANDPVWWTLTFAEPPNPLAKRPSDLRDQLLGALKPAVYRCLNNMFRCYLDLRVVLYSDEKISIRRVRA